MIKIPVWQIAITCVFLSFIPHVVRGKHSKLYHEQKFNHTKSLHSVPEIRSDGTQQTGDCHLSCKQRWAVTVI